jgi:hypothetical protein
MILLVDPLKIRRTDADWPTSAAIISGHRKLDLMCFEILITAKNTEATRTRDATPGHRITTSLFNIHVHNRNEFTLIT